DGLVYGIMRRALTTTHMTVSDDVSWRKIPRSKWYCGSHGSGSEPNKDGKKPVLPEDYAEVSCVAGKDTRLNLVELTRRQRKRLREKYYWDHVLWTHSRQLQRHRLWMRAKEDREFHEIIEEYQEILRREYEQMAQKQAAISVPRIAARPDEETARDRKQDVCLIDALRSLGVQLSYQDDGPFWALTDCAMPGKYVLFRAKHFMSLEVRADGTNMWRTTCKRHVGCADVKLPLLLRAMEAAFQLKELSISFCEQETDVLGGASSEIPVVEKMLESSATPSSLAGEGSASTALQSPADWLQVCRNRARVLERKRKTTQDVEEHSSSSTCSFAHSWNLAMPPMTLQCFGVAGSPAQGVRIPLLPLDEGIVALPVHPTGQEVSPEFTWLRRCHPHELDAAIRFQQDGHKYYVHDAEMDCSVTSLIAKFSEEFDADRIIQKMMAGHRWPREGYMKNLQDESLQIRIAAMPGLEEVARILQAPATTQQQVSVVLRNTLYKCDETAASLLQQLVMTPEEIKVHWRENGETAAAAGTWVHLLCECVLNGGTVTGVSEEMRSFNAFLRSTQPLIAYRTEWCIWASAEKIAGSIDFVAQDAQGDLVLFDWKRTKGLPDKFENRFACMKPPLGHLPDATGVKYRLQLNIYKRILEVGKIWYTRAFAERLFQDSKGCREVQTALEAASEDVRVALVAEIAGHVLDAMRCPHANHVLQKCITCSRPQHCQFIIEEIMTCKGFVELASRHKYGCRIIQRLLERCSGGQVEGIAAAILSDVGGISRHPYGNYVLQNLLEHGTPAHRRKLAQELVREIVPICQDSFGSAVVAAALPEPQAAGKRQGGGRQFVKLGAGDRSVGFGGSNEWLVDVDVDVNLG
ncbi:unnamed protein product, partial [Effrenium voratum]